MMALRNKFIIIIARIYYVCSDSFYTSYYRCTIYSAIIVIIMYHPFLSI